MHLEKCHGQNKSRDTTERSPRITYNRAFATTELDDSIFLTCFFAMDTPTHEPVMTPNVLHTPLATHRLAHKVAIITGGGGKIGIETAGRFLREGANVVLVDISRDALESAVFILREALFTGEIQESRIMPIVADVASESDVASLVKETIKQFHRLDIAFLNAGISYPATSLLETSEEDYERVMRVNVKSGKLSPGTAGYGGTSAAPCLPRPLQGRQNAYPVLQRSWASSTPPPP